MSDERHHMSAPSYSTLPNSRPRRSRCGPAVTEIPVRVEVVTPILGGGAQTRMVDEVDIIRAATVRGHLRFWWRALYSHQFQSPEKLYARESELWGRAATDEGGRSAIDIRIEVEQTGEIDDSDIHPQRTSGAYALFPAHSETKTNKPPVPRRNPGTRFRLTLIAPIEHEAEVRNVVRSWMLFGGYGSRTRRGLGSFMVVDDRNAWLPSKATREAITNLFQSDIFSSPGRPAIPFPWLGGATLHVAAAERDPIKAWTRALGWLKEFRQGTSAQAGDRAREPGTGKAQPERPSISNWPEADKIRHLEKKTSSHRPNHNATPVWPRAGFGLPIVGRFQSNARNGGRFDEPGQFEIRWRHGNGERDRLASPLIVKALPLADGSYVPCALWLCRAYPAGTVILKGRSDSAAPFDRLVAPGDVPRFSALANKQGLREAFLDWLTTKCQTTVVAP